jgi:hypothetical protein
VSYFDSRWCKQNFYDKLSDTIKQKPKAKIEVDDVVIVTKEDKIWKYIGDDLNNKIGIVVCKEHFEGYTIIAIDFGTKIASKRWETHECNGVIESNTGMWLCEDSVKVVSKHKM